MKAGDGKGKQNKNAAQIKNNEDHQRLIERRRERERERKRSAPHKWTPHAKAALLLAPLNNCSCWPNAAAVSTSHSTPPQPFRRPHVVSAFFVVAWLCLCPSPLASHPLLLFLNLSSSCVSCLFIVSHCSFACFVLFVAPTRRRRANFLMRDQGLGKRAALTDTQTLPHRHTHTHSLTQTHSHTVGARGAAHIAACRECRSLLS